MSFFKNKGRPTAPWSFVAASADLAGVARNKALLIGGAVFVSSRDVPAPGYAKLTPRKGVGQLAAWLDKDAPQVHVAVDQALMQAAPKGMRYALAVDAYLRWGLASRGKVLLIGGADAANQTTLDVFMFEEGRFIEYENKSLPGRNVPHFQTMLASLLEDYATQRPGYKILQAAPLAPFGAAFPHVSTLGPELFAGVAFRPLALQRQTRLAQRLLPAALVLTGVLGCAGAMGKGWHDYQGAIAGYEHEIADPIVTGKGGLDSGLIDTIQQRRFYLEEARSQVSMVERMRALVAGAGAVSELRIIEVRLPTALPGAAVSASAAAPAEAEAHKPDVWLRVSVPLTRGSAMEQGRALMERLAAATGLDMRLARQGWSDDGQRRIFILEGFNHA